MTEAIEITIFRLVAGRTAADFVAANADIDEWLNRQPGFRSRRIAEMADGSIVDLLIWASAADGHDAADRIMSEMGQSPVHAVIDQRSVAWRIAEVRQQTAKTP
jgi:antibiotic biosynthesis monooxygenase (ABM) superfamily enzyme